jgi:hypothetical protein
LHLNYCSFRSPNEKVVAFSISNDLAICFLIKMCEQPRKVAGVKARKIAEGERLRMIKSSG